MNKNRLMWKTNFEAAAMCALAIVVILLSYLQLGGATDLAQGNVNGRC